MEIVNVKEVEEQIYRKGFPKELINELLSQAEQGISEPKIPFSETEGVDSLNYQINFRIDENSSKAYLNSFDLSMTSPDIQRAHSFSNYHRITAKEAYRMLKFGEMVSVNKDLFDKDSQKYNTWLQLDLESKDGNGKYVMNSFHQNYYQKHPFELRADLQRLVRLIPSLAKTGELEKIEKKLKKAYLVAANGVVGQKTIPLLLSVNPKEGLIDVYDRKMELLDLTPDLEQQQKNSNAEDDSPKKNKGLKP